MAQSKSFPLEKKNKALQYQGQRIKKISLPYPIGSLVETGAAQPDPIGYLWTYTAIQENDNLAGNKIEIIAFDMPGNLATETPTL